MQSKKFFRFCYWEKINKFLFPFRLKWYTTWFIELKYQNKATKLLFIFIQLSVIIFFTIITIFIDKCN